jgi:hypothetical protein
MKHLQPLARPARDVLARLLDSPDLTLEVQSMEPQALVQLVQDCGLEECGAIVSLATTEQLVRVFDDDLWRQPEAGAEERFDTDRFAVWLAVLAEAGPDLAAAKLAAMDFDFVTAALSRYVLVVDSLAVMTLATEAEQEGNEASDELLAQREAAKGLLDDAVSLEIGGYTVVARRGEHWDALASILASLEQNHHALFGRLMSRCAEMASEWIVDNGGLYDVLSSEAQLLDDIAGDREARRDEQGYVPPQQAAAFLREARESPALAAPLASGSRLPQHADGGPRLGRIRARLASGDDADRERQELAYLANILVAGSTFAGHRFRAVEAAEAVLALCNLGLDISDSDGAGVGLTALFRMGWSVGHRDVVRFVAERLAAILKTLRCPDRELRRDIRGLAARLEAELAVGTPWRARDELQILAALDQPAAAILDGLIDECPVVPQWDPSAKAERVTPSFEFLSERRQVDWVREFVASLPARLV